MYEPSLISEIDRFVMCKEFGWTPEEYDRQKYVDIKKMKTMLSAFRIKQISENRKNNEVIRNLGRR